MAATTSSSEKKFILRFLLILIPLYLLVAWKPVDARVIVPFTHALARASAPLLSLIGEKVTVDGTLLHDARYAVNIHNGCNGVEALLILVASIMAFPAPLARRILGVLVSAVIVQIVNLGRIASLWWLGAYRPKLFEIFHGSVWQIVIILLAIGLFVVWSARFAKPRLANAR